MLLIGHDYVFRDPGSRHGSYINDARITSDVALRHGDRVQLGRTKLYFALVSQQVEVALKRISSEGAARSEQQEGTTLGPSCLKAGEPA